MCYPRFFAFILLISAHACGDSPKPPAERTPGTVRIASWNVLNLFDHTDDPLLSDRWDDLHMATPLGRCRAIAAVLRRIDADVVALQEVESLACLVWSRDTFLADMGYVHVASIDAGYHRGVECSMLSRIPIAEASVQTGVLLGPEAGGCCGTRTRPGQPNTPFRRPPLRIVLGEEGGDQLAIFVVHHKAGGGKANTWRREAEACHTVKSIETWRASHDGIPFILAGDFNAAAAECSVRTYLDAGLIDVMASPSTPTHASGRTIDFIMVSGELKERIVPGSNAVIDVPQPPPGWNWKTDRRPDEAPSDHFPLMVDVRWPSSACASTTSLSPRPERLTSTTWLESSSPAICIAPAMAWADSSAGRMPSRAHSN